MKKISLMIIAGIFLSGILFFGILYADHDIGIAASRLENDIRSSQKIEDDWTVEGTVSDEMAAFICYDRGQEDHTFSIYVDRPGLSFGYFFRSGGGNSAVKESIAEFTVEGYGERAFISMNAKNAERLEFDDGSGIRVIDIDSTKPFAIVLPANAGDISFYDVNGNVAEYHSEST